MRARPSVFNDISRDNDLTLISVFKQPHLVSFRIIESKVRPEKYWKFKFHELFQHSAKKTRLKYAEIQVQLKHWKPSELVTEGYPMVPWVHALQFKNKGLSPVDGHCLESPSRTRKVFTAYWNLKCHRRHSPLTRKCLCSLPSAFILSRRHSHLPIAPIA